MSLDPETRDQAYNFFVAEAPELLQNIESGLLTLRQDYGTAKVHSIMRSAHSIKGGAAGVGLDGIKSIAHRLEDIFKALYHAEDKITPELERKLLQAYDCLQQPLTEQIETGQVVSGTQLVEEARGNLNQITEVSNQINELVAKIAEAAKTQAVDSEQVNETIRAVAAIAQQTSDSATQVSESFKELQQTARDLEENVGQFKVE
jgi:chemotaxis protein histidine kinase CheA